MDLALVLQRKYRAPNFDFGFVAATVAVGGLTKPRLGIILSQGWLQGASAMSGAKNSLALIRREIVILCLVGLLIFVAVTALQGLGVWHAPEFLVRGLQDLGLSLVEASLVMVIIDVRASREQIEQSLDLIKRATSESKTLIGESIEETKRAAQQSMLLTQKAIQSVFDSVYKKNVPPELIDLYESTIFNRNFFRLGTEYTYTLHYSKGTAPESLIQVTAYQKYIVKNLTPDDLEYELSCETSVLEGQSERFRSFSLLVDEKEEQVGKGTEVERPGYKAIVFNHRVPIAGGRSRTFELKWDTMRRARDVEILMSAWPSDGMSVIVNAGPHLEVSVNALHPRPMTPRRDIGGDAHKWSLKAGIVEGQGLCISWEPRTP